jgi:stress-induced morphogen
VRDRPALLPENAPRKRVALALRALARVARAAMATSASSSAASAAASAAPLPSGPVAQLLVARLRRHLAPVAALALEDESHRHSRGAESHFKLLVVSPRFEGLAPLARHRLVLAAAATDADADAPDPAATLPVHALSIQARTPAQFEAAGGEASLQATPGCRGGGE